VRTRFEIPPNLLRVALAACDARCTLVQPRIQTTLLPLATILRDSFFSSSNSHFCGADEDAPV
jgi:hypothetical protein